jgi:nucleotide-binding universal stress UspA family protein
MKSKINKIIIPTDFSDLSENAFKTGIEIARRQHAEVKLLHVIEPVKQHESLEVNGSEKYRSIGTA